MLLLWSACAVAEKLCCAAVHHQVHIKFECGMACSECNALQANQLWAERACALLPPNEIKHQDTPSQPTRSLRQCGTHMPCNCMLCTCTMMSNNPNFHKHQATLALHTVCCGQQYRTAHDAHEFIPSNDLMKGPWRAVCSAAVRSCRQQQTVRACQAWHA
jgi:hypothetical protein